MSKLIAAPGGAIHANLARFEDQGFRANQWQQILIDNQDGQIVNQTAGTLHYEDHRRMLDDVVAARKYMPTVYESLVAAPGIAVDVSLYETQVGYTNMNEFDAQTSMNGSNRESNETDYKYNWTPQPIYHSDFHIPWRQGGFAYKQADGATEATMQVALERDKTMVLGNDQIVVNVNGVEAQLYGLTNSPATFSAAGAISDWANEANSDVVSKEAIELVSILYAQRIAAQVPNSVIVYVANDISTALENDYSTQKGDRTNLERIKAITAIRDVILLSRLPDGAVLLVEATPMTLRIPRSQDITVAPWTRTNNMESQRFTVFAASTLQIRQDRNGNGGVLYATKA